jgi:hypothetical protein
MREYPKQIKRLIREYAARAYEAELGQALGELEAEFTRWRSGELSAGELSDRIHTFHQGPARELWSRYNARIDDTLVAHAIVTGLLPREIIPAECWKRSSRSWRSTSTSELSRGRVLRKPADSPLTLIARRPAEERP